jgi:Family of unknown function (DUF6535)
VTAFIIESSKSLDKDELLIYLDIILRQIQASSGVTAGTPPSLPSPSSTDKAVNAGWFISLIFSLFGAFVCILGKKLIQDEYALLRELHLRPPRRHGGEAAEIQDIVAEATRNMRQRDIWESRTVLTRLHHVFDCVIPIVFQISLGIFLVGLVIRFSFSQAKILFSVLGCTTLTTFLGVYFMFYCSLR